jgi:RNA-directed DNA polymerase
MLRRHPGKRRSLRYRKYLTRIGSRGHVLESAYLDRRGKPHPIRLVNASGIPIKRHINVKAAANPYDPTWAP